MSRDIDLLYEIGAIRHIDRMWKRFHGLTVGNLADHHFRVAWIALIIAEREGVKNTDKILKMALVHDIAESRTGDVDYLARQYVERNEELGIRDMLKDTAVEKEMLAIWEEYEKRESIEAKIVKDADNLDVDFEVFEQISNGSELAKKWSKDERPAVVKKKLYTKTAKKIFDDLKNSDPHGWHLNGRNRLNAGDWKEPRK